MQSRFLTYARLLISSLYFNLSSTHNYYFYNFIYFLFIDILCHVLNLPLFLIYFIKSTKLKKIQSRIQGLKGIIRRLLIPKSSQQISSKIYKFSKNIEAQLKVFNMIKKGMKNCNDMINLVQLQQQP